MIIIGVGGNIPFGSMSVPATLNAALDAFSAYGIRIHKRSSFYHSKPVPASDQPWFFNAVVSCTTELSPQELLRALLSIEQKFGRMRSVKNAARTLDLDIIDYDGKIIFDNELEIPHPRLASRAFILLPLMEIAPDWKHPQSGIPIADLVKALTDETLVNTKKL
ncbi:MAG: 2-amino-4-hydroxy-6-hydroxymethyldihydropteridine diphosphokinase [Alphaproteobacteria bacterium]|nr:2-amino-4-hydroxy-6-hydroxymethyldihydropteridine diphosphokinase [Alphaproteobacteria bacterium]